MECCLWIGRKTETRPPVGKAGWNSDGGDFVCFSVESTIRCKVNSKKAGTFLRPQQIFKKCSRPWPGLDSGIVVVLQNYGHRRMQDVSPYLLPFPRMTFTVGPGEARRMVQQSIIFTRPFWQLRQIDPGNYYSTAASAPAHLTYMLTVPLLSIQILQLRLQCSQRGSGCLIWIRIVRRQY
jgi:hypothetical protein